MVILRTELGIGRNNRDFNDSDNVDNADDGQETKDVVVSALILPQTAEDEEQLNKDDGERHEACQQENVDTLRIPRLLRDLARYTAGFGWMFIRLAVIETVPATNINKWKLNE